MGKLTKSKREKIESLVLGTVKRLDNFKMENYKRYENLFKVMTDEEFETWANTMGHDLDDTIQIFQLPFEEMRLPQIKDAANFLKLPLEEYVWFRHHDPNGIRTKNKVLVGYVHIKRLQQLLAKKNKYGITAEKTSLKTGQVSGDDKVASITDPETFFLTAINANKALEEFLGPRADNEAKKLTMYKNIATDGYTTLESLPNDISRSVTLNTINTYLLASGIRSDLVIDSLKTLYNINQDIKKK